MKIQFGTDGWRAIIGDDYTVENVAKVTHATAVWLKKQKTKDLTVIIGYDCRFGGKMFAEHTAQMFCKHNINVILSKDICSTPMISFAVKHYNADLGIIITASHNPSNYNGFKIKGDFGGPLEEKNIKQIESLIPNSIDQIYKSISISTLTESKKIIYKDLQKIYIKQIEQNFNIKKLQENSNKFIYDAMFGSGQKVMKELFPNMHFLNAEINPSFNNIAPEPIMKNLTQLSKTIKLSEGKLILGISTDGDADRIGLFDEAGNFIDSHHILLLLIHYLVKKKKLKGKVIFTFSVSSKVQKLCEYYNLEYEITKIGFKYIAPYLITNDCLIGGEESGGIALINHIPERDGIWIGLTIGNYLIEENKLLSELIKEIYDIVGVFKFERNDLHLSEEKKKNVITNLNTKKYKKFDTLKILKHEALDGHKFYFKDEEWIMIRPSGTEPVLRVYAEAKTKKRAEEIIKIVSEIILQ